MKCKYCGIEAIIDKSYTEVEGDRSPDTPTKVYTVQEITCRNPRCGHYQKHVETVRHLIYQA